MKRYLTSAAVILAVLVTAWAAFGQQQGRARQRQQTERTRQRFQDMSEEEREKLRAQMRERGGSRRGGFMDIEGQQEAIKVIEEQLAKLKAGMEGLRPEAGKSFQDLSEQERAELREKFTKARQERQKALQTITAQVARLQGRGQPAAQGGQYLIINVGDLKPIQDSAVKEKAKETAQLLERLIGRAQGQRGPGGGPPGPRTGRTEPGATERPRGPRGAESPRGPGRQDRQERER